MFHTSLNNFRSYYNGYPFKSNVIDEIQVVGEAPDETIIAGAHEQIEALLTMKPFDPEEFGFVKNVSSVHPDHNLTMWENGTQCFFKYLSDEPYGHWGLIMRKYPANESPLQDDKDAFEIRLMLYIPNDLAGRVILTALGIVKRRDLDEEGKGCPDDHDLDGMCVMCENNGTCLNKKQ